jgi:hypothetical protein
LHLVGTVTNKEIIKVPEDNLDTTTSSETSDTDLLSEEKEETTPPEDSIVDEGKEEEEEETEEESETKEESTEEDEEEDTDEEKITRPSWKEIKEKYPEIAKNKEFREVYFREKAFSEIFPTVEDAKEAGEKARVLEVFDASLIDGDPSYLVQNLSPKSLEGFTNKVLPALRNLNKDLFLKATAPVLVDIVNNIHEHALTKGDKNLETSVLNICNWLFGDFKIPPRMGGRVDPEVEREKKTLQQERANLLLGQRKEFTGKVERSIGRQLTKLVSEGLGIDNEFVASSIVKETIDKVKSTIYSDKDFIARVQSIYAQAERAGYSPEYATRVVSAYLGRAKGIALKARAELKASALRKQSSKGSGEDTKRVVRTEKGTRESSKKSDKVDLRNTRLLSDLDILNQP